MAGAVPACCRIAFGMSPKACMIIETSPRSMGNLNTSVKTYIMNRSRTVSPLR